MMQALGQPPADQPSMLARLGQALGLDGPSWSEQASQLRTMQLQHAPLEQRMALASGLVGGFGGSIKASGGLLDGGASAAFHMPAAGNEAGANILARGAEDLGQGAVSSPALVENARSLNVKARPDVLPVMSGLLQHPEVAKSVVRLLPVDVMHMLGGAELTPERLLHNPSMLVDALIAHANHPVSGGVQAVDVLAPYVTRGVAESPLAGTDSAALLQEGLAARGAGALDLHFGKIPRPSDGGNSDSPLDLSTEARSADLLASVGGVAGGAVAAALAARQQP